MKATTHHDHIADPIRELGELALGSRLRRLSDFIMKDGERIYERCGLDFNPRWFPVFHALARAGETGVTELADLLGLSHPAVIKTVRELESRHLVRSRSDPEDGRKRMLSLTAEARVRMPDFERNWRDIVEGMHEAVVETGYDVMDVIGKLEDALRRGSLSRRVLRLRAERQLEEVEILEYTPELAGHFRRINYAWIEKDFDVEDEDRRVLDHPEEEILDRGGAILFARTPEGEIAGTCALARFGDGVFELTKMGVDESFRGRQIGKALGLATLAKARELGARKVFLISNRKLKPAISLYRRLGFEEVSIPEKTHYQRGDIQMEMEFEKGNER